MKVLTRNQEGGFIERFGVNVVNTYAQTLGTDDFSLHFVGAFNF